MKKIIITLSVMALLFSGVAFASDTATVDCQANLQLGIEISVLPTTIDFGNIELNTTYDTNPGSNPDVVLSPKLALTLDSFPALPLDIYMSSTNPTNGSINWNLADTAGTDQIKLTAMLYGSTNLSNTPQLLNTSTPISTPSIQDINYGMATPTDSTETGLFTWQYTLLGVAH